jgi:serine/threonine-protein kinase
MSPEQARGDAIDHRSDLYSLGVIAYRALTGRPAVASAEIMTMLHDVCNRMPPQPSAVADLPPVVDDVLLVAMAKAPGERFGNARELADALAAAAHGKLSLDLQLRAAAVARSWPWARVRERE